MLGPRRRPGHPCWGRPLGFVPAQRSRRACRDQQTGRPCGACTLARAPAQRPRRSCRDRQTGRPCGGCTLARTPAQRFRRACRDRQTGLVQKLSQDTNAKPPRPPTTIVCKCIQSSWASKWFKRRARRVRRARIASRAGSTGRVEPARRTASGNVAVCKLMRSKRKAGSNVGLATRSPRCWASAQTTVHSHFRTHASFYNSALAFFRSGLPKPSVNRP